MAMAAEGFIRCLYEGCITGCDSCIERRPYHRNCGCAFHKPMKGCPHTLPKSSNISYPIRRSWSEGCLALMSSTNGMSPSLSPPPMGREVDKNF